VQLFFILFTFFCHTGEIRALSLHQEIRRTVVVAGKETVFFFLVVFVEIKAEFCGMTF